MDNISNLIEREIKQFGVKEPVLSPKVSVIVPVYNGEKYLFKCLMSLIRQTLKEIEIIVINDGSTDNSSLIISKFINNDNRIKVLNQANKGVSSARNVGVKEAKGKYIAFIDSDDWVNESYIENLYNSIVQNGCDIAVATMIRKRKNSKKYRIHCTEEKTYTSLKDKVGVCRVPMCSYACGKLFKKDLIKNLNFKENVYFEDVIWLPQILAMSNKLTTTTDATYYYRVNNNSIVKKTPSKKKQSDSYRAKKFALEYLSSKGIDFPGKIKNLTKEIKYFFNIPILKVKELNDIETIFLFGVIPIFKKPVRKKLKYKNIKKFLFFKKLDKHYYIELFKCLKLSFKSGDKFKYIEAGEYGTEKIPRKTKLIVSLTSFPDRINTIDKTINTLLNQTVKPDKLILRLADSQFPNKENDLPEKLLKLKDLGLEIGWCEDLKSYKKLVPALKEFPNDIIVTADDDLYYQKDWLESLYDAYLKNPDYIYTKRACGINLENNILSVIPHYANNNYKPSFLNQLMGGAGTLYPPNSLDNDVFNIDLIKTLIPTHDDIYFWIMAILRGTKICLIKSNDASIYNVENSQNQALCKHNGNNQTGMRPGEAFGRILQYYPKAYDLIENESTDVKS